MYGYINLNDIIYVELLEDGWNIISKYYEELFDYYDEAIAEKFISDGIEMYKRRTNKYLVDGGWKELTSFQFYDFMFIFGSSFVPGRLNDSIGGNHLYLSINTSSKLPNEYEDEKSKKEDQL